MLLNNDTIVLPGAIQKLRENLHEEKVGAIGPCMPYSDNQDIVWACGGFIRNFRLTISGRKEVIKPEPNDVDYLPGAAILCKMNVWDQVGDLPEKYFLAYEEAKFALRVKNLNYRIMVHPKAKILHKVGMTSINEPM